MNKIFVNDFNEKIEKLLRANNVDSESMLEGFLSSHDFLNLCCDQFYGKRGKGFIVQLDVNDRELDIDINFCSARGEATISIIKEEDTYKSYFLGLPVKKSKEVVHSVIDIDNHKLYSYSDYKTLKQSKRFYLLSANNLIKLTNFLYSTKTQKEIFNPIIADWEHELDFEQLFNKRKWKIRWINVIYTYAFIGAMWQKSPLADLLEFIRKFAK